MTVAIHVLRIVKAPDGGSTAFRPGTFCRGGLHAYTGGPIVFAELYAWPLDAAASLAMAEKRHPGLELEIVRFVEDAP